MTPARCLAIFGTASDVGKSIVAAALCRMASDLGLRVAPFKAQNMSNNSWVTQDGGEMGRAQVVQAQAARVDPHVDMNPVLLKPASDKMSQVVLHGQPLGNVEASAYFKDTSFLKNKALESLARLCAQYEVVIIEGAGSCAEVNLRPRDFVNFEMAHAADAPVLIVADIDRGGVFAQVVGTLEVLPPEDRKRVAGFVINRFRGDPTLFEDGMDYLRQRTGLPVFGPVEYFRHIDIDSEDGLPLEVLVDPPVDRLRADDRLRIGVLRLPHISNFTDFMPLSRHPGVALHYLARPRDLAGYDLVLLPGSKNVRYDRDWLAQAGWDAKLGEYRKAGGRIGGICGGYQLLGDVIEDPRGIEGTPGSTPGLGLLRLSTRLEPRKILTRCQGVWTSYGAKISGYEIHMGVTTVHGHAPAVRLTQRQNEAVDLQDGAVSEDGRVWGTYLHGLFDEPVFTQRFLQELRPGETLPEPAHQADIDAFREKQYDLLAEHFRRHISLEDLRKWLGK